MNKGVNRTVANFINDLSKYLLYSPDYKHFYHIFEMFIYFQPSKLPAPIRLKNMLIQNNTYTFYSLFKQTRL